MTSEEPTSELYAEQVEADKEKFREVFSDAMHLNVRVTKAYRVGKPGQEKPRLLLVGLENTEIKRDLLKLTLQLRSTDLWKNVYLSPDLTWKEREESRRLREELRRRTDVGEVNLTIRKGRDKKTGPDSDSGS